MPQDFFPLLEPEGIYHIFNRANGSENLFRKRENYHYFLRKYGEYIFPVAATYAYCLMPNHFHLMVRVRSEEEVLGFLREKNPNQTLEEFSKTVSKQFSHLFNGYTQALNKMYDRSGSLFQPRFKRKSVTNNQYFTTLLYYIHFNPVHHGFCQDVFDWEHSSVHAFLNDKKTQLERQAVLEWFGGKKQFRHFHHSTADFQPIHELIIE